MKTEILFVRHGETISNQQQILCGRTDVPLTERGRDQARWVAQRLAELDRLSCLYASPLQRARTTAQIIGDRLGLPLQIRDDLAEFNFGALEGYTLARIQSEFPELYTRILDLTDSGVMFPNGESRQGFHQRVRVEVEQLIAVHRGERIIVVAHGGVIGSAIAQWTGGDPNDWVRWQVRNCSLTHLALDGQASATLHCWNDVSHFGAV